MQPRCDLFFNLFLFRPKKIPKVSRDALIGLITAIVVVVLIVMVIIHLATIKRGSTFASGHPTDRYAYCVLELQKALVTFCKPLGHPFARVFSRNNGLVETAFLILDPKMDITDPAEPVLDDDDDDDGDVFRYCEEMVYAVRNGQFALVQAAPWTWASSISKNLARFVDPNAWKVWESIDERLFGGGNPLGIPNEKIEPFVRFLEEHYGHGSAEFFVELVTCYDPSTEDFKSSEESMRKSFETFRKPYEEFNALWTTTEVGSELLVGNGKVPSGVLIEGNAGPTENFQNPPVPTAVPEFGGEARAVVIVQDINTPNMVVVHAAVVAITGPLAEGSTTLYSEVIVQSEAECAQYGLSGRLEFKTVRAIEKEIRNEEPSRVLQHLVDLGAAVFDPSGESAEVDLCTLTPDQLCKFEKFLDEYLGVEFEPPTPTLQLLPEPVPKVIPEPVSKKSQVGKRRGKGPSKSAKATPPHTKRGRKKANDDDGNDEDYGNKARRKKSSK